MNFNFFSLFQSNKSELIVPDSILVKRIKSLARNSNLKVFSNIEIYLHTKRYPIELMLYDDVRGIYIFEIKKWSFDDLKNATIEKAQNQEHANNTLAFDKTQELIKRKLNEITHQDNVKIFKYLLMENLSAEEYERLDDSFKELLPKNKIIFSDSLASDIFKQLQTEEELFNKPSIDILETLLTQYAKLDDTGNYTLCNDSEIEFLNTPLQKTSYIELSFGENKNALLILKAIIEAFTKKSKVIFIKPSTLSRDIAYKKLLEILEHGIVALDMNMIEFLTPLELINKHLLKLKKPLIADLEEFHISSFNKRFNIADLIICDDAQFLNQDFLQYLESIQKNKQLLFVNHNATNSKLILLQNNQNITLLRTNPFAKCMQLLQKLLETEHAQDILVVSNPQTRKNLQEDLEYFLAQNLSIIDAKSNLLERDLTQLKLTSYDDMFELSTKHIILLDLCEYNEKQIEYALNLATKNAYVLYDTPCEITELLKEKYESKQE